MDDIIIIAVNKESSDVFIEFAKEHSETFQVIEHKSFIGSKEIIEFIVTVTPHLLTALAAYLVARIQNSKKKLELKKVNWKLNSRA